MDTDELVKQIRAIDEQRHDLLIRRGDLIRQLVALGDEQREQAGHGPAGKARAAEALGVTPTQVYRLLAQDIERRVRKALARWGRGDYQLNSGTAGVTVSLSLEVLERSATARGNAANALVSDLRAAGLEVSHGNLAVDVGGEGPCAALADGQDVDVDTAS